MLTDLDARGSCFCFPLVLPWALGGWKVEAEGRGLSAHRAGTGDLVPLWKLLRAKHLSTGVAVTERPLGGGVSPYLEQRTGQ